MAIAGMTAARASIVCTPNASTITASTHIAGVTVAVSLSQASSDLQQQAQKLLFLFQVIGCYLGE